MAGLSITCVSQRERECPTGFSQWTLEGPPQWCDHVLSHDLELVLTIAAVSSIAYRMRKPYLGMKELECGRGWIGPRENSTPLGGCVRVVVNRRNPAFTVLASTGREERHIALHKSKDIGNGPTAAIRHTLE